MGPLGPNFFRGCDCKANCNTNSCTCYVMGRECDPSLCRRCGCCTDPPYQTNGRQNCQNDSLTMKRKCRLRIGRSTIPEAGYGAFSIEPINRGALIGEYVGELISHNESDRNETERRGHYYNKTNRSFFFTMDKRLVIDATWKGNDTRYINHSDTPNCNARRVFAQGSYHIGYYARTNIDPGTELFVDYGALMRINDQTNG
jgi:[histone H3]-lysine27 N-trimethyltransferase EZH2